MRHVGAENLARIFRDEPGPQNHGEEVDLWSACVELCGDVDKFVGEKEFTEEVFRLYSTGMADEHVAEERATWLPRIAECWEECKNITLHTLHLMYGEEEQPEELRARYPKLVALLDEWYNDGMMF